VTLYLIFISISFLCFAGDLSRFMRGYLWGVIGIRAKTLRRKGEWGKYFERSSGDFLG